LEEEDLESIGGGTFMGMGQSLILECAGLGVDLQK